MLKRHQHTPAHLFFDNRSYFITGAIYKKRKLLNTQSLKLMLLEKMYKYFHEYNWELTHWVILDNHYHLMVISSKGSTLTEIIKRIHGSSSHFIVQATKCDTPVWWNYWDYCPRDEKGYYIRLNYLLYNPVKHGYVADLNDYEASSFSCSIKEIGRDALAKQFYDYPQYKQLILTEANRDDF